MSGDEYIALLLARQAADTSARSDVPAWLRQRPLEHYVRPGDEHLFTPLRETPQPKRATTPRTYLPASYWAERLAAVEARMAVLIEPLAPERAATGGQALGARRTARLVAAEDARLRRYADLHRQAEGLRARLAAARAREEGAR